MRNLTSLVVVLGSSLLFTACANKSSSDQDSPTDAVDSSDSTEAEGNMMMSAVDNSNMTSLTAVTDVQVAAAIAANIGTRFLPAGCASATATGANVAVTYTNCSGPRGLLDVTGSLALAVSVDGTGAISVHGTATDLQVNKATLDIDATGVYSVNGDTHTLTVQTSGSGTGPRGTAVDHDGDYTISWDESTACGTLNGNWSTEIGAKDRSNTVDITRCAGACPTGTLEHDFLAGIKLNVTFDGSATATWSLSTGGSGSVALGCTPAS